MPDLPIRKFLPHEMPENVPGNPEGEIFFITICCVPRGENQLARLEAWEAIKETFLHREKSGELHARLLVAMPDHLHALVSFRGSQPMKKVVSNIKVWLARKHGIQWQRDFFDHRLRSWESAEEKGAYIRANPFRAGLIREGENWPYMLDRVR